MANGEALGWGVKSLTSRQKFGLTPPRGTDSPNVKRKAETIAQKT
jgi:hypothetical protein